LKAVITNVSDHEISTFRLSAAGNGYDIEVHDENGKQPRSAAERRAEENKKTEKRAGQSGLLAA
jgi:hypothetical protein